MKKIIVITLMLFTAVFAYAKKDWKGKVVDQNGEPLAYANVAVLSKADSTVVCGGVTGEDGTFDIVTKENDGIMMVAMIGYKTVYITPVDGQVITLPDDTTMLESAVAIAVMPKTKLTGEGLQTSVRGSVLENVGTAKDVLSKTPGMIKGTDGSLEVIGKGAPVIYINGHKVNDASELDRLQSNEIQSIEVITNPGAQYDATVRSVVRIRTVRRQGEGFGFNFYASDLQSFHWSNGNDRHASFNANYRTGGVDVFAGVNYDRSTQRQLSTMEKNTFGKVFFQEKGPLDNKYIGQGVYGNAGINWQLADNHFLGAKMEWGTTFRHKNTMVIDDSIYEDGQLTDIIKTETEDNIHDTHPHNFGTNVYYNGLVGGKLGIDINLDYYGNYNHLDSRSVETSKMADDALIQSTSETDGKLYAAKAVLTYPVWQGQLTAGTEEAFSRRTDSYGITGAAIKPSSAEIKEDNVAGFASYGFFVNKVGQFSAGIRYEHVKYSYEDALAPANNLDRTYGNWFPTFSYAGVAGNVQYMLNYSKKTKRPNYGNLSNAIRYNSKYTWQGGNALLQPETSNNISASAVWKFVTFAVDYSRVDDQIMVWSAPYNDDGVVLVQPRNINTPYRKLAAFVNITPTIGIWNINYTIGLTPQWLKIRVQDGREASGYRETRFNGKPIFFAQMFNTFTLKGGWQLELGTVVNSKGYSQNIHLKNVYFDLTAAIQKTLLADGSLVLRLEGNDLARKAHYNVDTDFGNHTISQTNIMDTQYIRFSVRYNFNTTRSKYRGTGAGSDSRSRM